jgi:hypothetical protein
VRQEPTLVAVTRDQLQKRTLKLPKHDLRMAAVPGHPARSLRRIPGYDIRNIPGMNKITTESILDSGGWAHTPSGFIVSAGVEDTGKWGPLLHVSMSYRDHDPTWDEIKQVKALFFPPDVGAAMIIPRPELYVNVHRFCYHVWQMPEDWNLG